MPKQSLHIIFESKQLVHTNLLDNRGNLLSIIFVYGNPNHSKREEVWSKLRNLKLSTHPRWLCIGDFNQIFNFVDKFSFNHGSIPGVELFQEVISDLALCELASIGKKFTWMNKRDEEDFVMEMIDRAFVNVDWVNAYTNYALRNLPIIRSNYGPIILDFEYLQPFKRRPFRFKRMWLCHPTCKSMVQQAWNSHTVGSRTFQLRHKLLSALGTKRFLER